MALGKKKLGDGKAWNAKQKILSELLTACQVFSELLALLSLFRGKGREGGG